MRIVVLCSSIYSETACAMAVRLADLGYAPVGALSLSSLNRDTLLRKLSQWGVRQLAQYARNKLAPGKHKHSRLQNPYLQPWLERRDNVFLNLRNIAKSYDFPIRILANQNSADAISRLKLWAPDLVVFTGGNILRKDTSLTAPRRTQPASWSAAASPRHEQPRVVFAQRCSGRNHDSSHGSGNRYRTDSAEI